MSQVTWIPNREFDHNNDCIGCGASLSDNVPCDPTCPFETGKGFSPAVILRAAARRLHSHLGARIDVGCSIYMAAVELVGRDQAHTLAAEAKKTLADYLISVSGLPLAMEDVTELAAEIVIQAIDRQGMSNPIGDITLVLYGAAKQFEEHDVDPDDF